MYYVTYKETYVGVYAVPDACASTKREAEEWVREQIQSGYTSGPDECCDSSMKTEYIPDKKAAMG